MLNNHSNFLGTIAILLLISAVVAPGCKTDKEDKVKGPRFDNSLPGKDGIRNAVLGYNQAVMDARLSDRHVKFIRYYASDNEAKRIFVFINTDREKGVAMATKVNKMVFNNISASEKTGYADTSENWDFHNLDIKTSKPVEQVREMRYELRYLLVKERDKWIVSKIREREKALVGDYIPPRWSLTGK